MITDAVICLWTKTMMPTYQCLPHPDLFCEQWKSGDFKGKSLESTVDKYTYDFYSEFCNENCSTYKKYGRQVCDSQTFETKNSKAQMRCKWYGEDDDPEKSACAPYILDDAMFKTKEITLEKTAQYSFILNRFDALSICAQSGQSILGKTDCVNLKHSCVWWGDVCTVKEEKIARRYSLPMIHFSELMDNCRSRLRENECKIYVQRKKDQEL
jgi:hypothetical protein